MAEIDDFDAPPHDVEHDEPHEPGQKRSLGKSVAAAWQASPVFKIFLLLVGGGAIASAALGVFTSDKPKDVSSRISNGSNISATPGGEAPPAFQEAVTEASRQRAQGAAQAGGSAMPTPMGSTTQMTQLEGGQNAQDPLAEFRAPQPAQPQGQPAQPQMQPQQPGQPQQQVAGEPPMDQGLATAMQQQMQGLIKSWGPEGSRVISVTKIDEKTTEGTGTSGQQTEQQNNACSGRGTTLVPAGTINYGQMLIEANSDVPGTIMAQVLSGPFTGGKAIGRFSSTEDYLIMTFSNINYKGKDYGVNVIALNPDTTLGAVASDVDHRYLQRVLIPAAADFVSGFANAFTQDNNSTTYIQDGVVINQRTRAGLREGLAQGGQEAGQRLSNVVNQEASNIRPLVRMQVGTPIGLFFTQTVTDQNSNPDCRQQLQQQQGLGGQYANSPYGALYNAAQQQLGIGGQQQYGAQQGYPTSPYTGGYGTTATGYAPQTNNAYAPLNTQQQQGYSGGYPSNAYGGNGYGSGITIVPTGGTPTVINGR